MGFLNIISNAFNRISKQHADSSDCRQFRKAIKNNSDDHILRTRFAKHCLQYCFAKKELVKELCSEAIEQFETITRTDVFDPEFFYLMGRFYQNIDERKAQSAYLEGIKRFNQYIEKNPGLRNQFMEITLATALNLLTLKSNPIDPELEKFFKLVRKSYPLHIKRVELEKEIENRESDPGRVQQLKEELKRLKATQDEKMINAKEKPLQTID